MEPEHTLELGSVDLDGDVFLSGLNCPVTIFYTRLDFSQTESQSRFPSTHSHSKSDGMEEFQSRRYI